MTESMNRWEKGEIANEDLASEIVKEVKLKQRFCEEHQKWDYIGWYDDNGNEVHIPLIGMLMNTGWSTRSDDPRRSPWDFEAWAPPTFWDRLKGRRTNKRGF